MLRDVILVTCGTSLKNNMKNLEVKEEHFSSWIQEHDPSYKGFGAEINSLHAIMQEYPDQVAPKEVVLYLSDTEDAKIVEAYLLEMIPLFFNVSVQSRTIAGLDMSRPDIFRRQGLCNLVGALAKDFRAHGASRTVICATGGFKAMVGIAQTFANAASVPAYYRFEFASAGMMMPPLPVSFDLSLWLRLYEALSVGEEEGVVAEKDMYALMENLLPEDKERLQVMLERDGGLFALTPLGQLFYEIGGLEFLDRSEDLLPSPVGGEKPPLQNSSKEAPAEAFERKSGVGNKLLTLPYVGKVWIHYFNVGLGRNTARCHVKEVDNNILEVEFGNGKSLIGYKLEIPGATKPDQLYAAAVDVNKHLHSW